MNPHVTIIILNWNGYKDTLECLESLYQITYPNYTVIIVDNASTDSSLEQIRKYCEGHIPIESPFFSYSDKNKPVRLYEYTKDEAERAISQQNEIAQLPSNQKLILIKNDRNDGFAEGNNIGIRYAIKAFEPDYVFLLNNDTVVEKNFLTKLVEVAQSDDNIGMLGPKNYFYQKKGESNIISFAGGKINLNKYPGYFNIGENMADSPQFNQGIIECDWITGASMMLPVKKIPFTALNSDLFFGCEDADLGIKLRKNGFKIVMVLEASIWHKCGRTRKNISRKKVRKILMETKTNFKFLKMHQRYFYFFIPVYFIQWCWLVLYNAAKRIRTTSN